MSGPVIVYGFHPTQGVLDISPFVHKLELYMLLAGTPYEKRIGDSRKAPRGKLPYIEHDGNTIPDSQVAIEYLRTKGLADLDSWLTPIQQAESFALRSMLENDLYFVLVFMRWKLDAGWESYNAQITALLGLLGIPSFLRPVVLRKARGDILMQLSAQGTGRREDSEVADRLRSMLTTLETFLGRSDGPWWFGDRPSCIDTVVHAFFSGLYCMGVPLPVTMEEFQRWPALLGHHNHVEGQLTVLGGGRGAA